MLRRTGGGVGGSGGAKRSKVKETIIEGSGHQVPFEKVKETASAIGEWMSPELQKWTEDEVRVSRGWANQSAKDRLSMPASWIPILESLYEHPERDSKL